MKKIKLHKDRFLRTMFLVLLFHGLWSLLYVMTGDYTDKNFYAALVFVLLLPAALHFGQRKKPLIVLLLFSVLLILLFLVSSFILLPLVMRIPFIEAILYPLLNSIFLSVILTGILQLFYGVAMPRIMMIATAVFVLLGYLLFTLLQKIFTHADDYGLLLLFNSFQLLLALPLAFGLNAEKAGAGTPGETVLPSAIDHR